MAEKENISGKSRHTLSVSDREHITLSGIEDLLSFDENSIVLQSCLGTLTVDGRELNIIQLNLEQGNVEVEGKLDGLYYMEQRKRKSIFGGR